jgi:hypothetical protein
VRTIKPALVIQQKLAVGMGLDKYGQIMEVIHTTDISINEKFQRTFNSLYMVRRNEEWRSAYYKLFESVKNDEQVNFSFILDELYEKTGNVEASFASKMLATIKPEMPIWDKYVVKNLGLKVPAQSDPERIQKTKDLYENICKWYDTYLQTRNAIECIEMFDKMLPDYTWLSPVKKIDFYLWSIR